MFYKDILFFSLRVDKMQGLLFLGTSEVGVLERIREQLKQINETNIFVSCNSGANLLLLGQRLTHFLTSSVITWNL